MKHLGIDLLQLISAITRKQGLDPGDYHQTLKEANGKRWGASSIIRQGGMGIDKVFQEFNCYYPGMFESLDDFVEALADRLGRNKTIQDIYHPEEIADVEENKDAILLRLQTKHRVNKLETDVLGDLIIKKGQRGILSKKGVKKILEVSLDE